jgi:4a-hydroxytetrahydrobiopterin dehydratase
MAQVEQETLTETSGDLLTAEKARELAGSIPGWSLKEKEIEREYTFQDFRGAMKFVNRVADLAETQDHHPDICISYNRVRLVLSTHKAGGLTFRDFFLARMIDTAEKE